MKHRRYTQIFLRVNTEWKNAGGRVQRQNQKSETEHRPPTGDFPSTRLDLELVS
jgi:hypothetical protein